MAAGKNALKTDSSDATEAAVNGGAVVIEAAAPDIMVDDSRTVSGVMIAGQLIVGSASLAAGTLAVADGATVTVGNALALGNAAGSSGTVALGAASLSTYNFTVGNQGTGVFSVGDGGSVTALSLVAGNLAGSSGTVTIGTGSSLHIVSATGTAGPGAPPLQGFALGKAAGASGSLTVEAGATVTSVEGFSIGAAGAGQAMVAGILSVAGALSLGLETTGAGALVINGGTLSAGYVGLGVGGGGAISVGGDATRHGVLSTKNIYMSIGASGALYINSYGQVDAPSTTLYLGSGANGAAHINVSGAGSSLVLRGLNFGTAIDGNGPSVSIGNGGVVTVAGPVTLSANEVISLSGGTFAGSIGLSGGTIQGFGLVTGAITGTGSLVAQHGVLKTNAAASATLHIGDQGTLELGSTPFGTPITFDAGVSQALILDTPGTTITAPIHGLSAGDVIAFNLGGGVRIAGSNYGSGQLTLMLSNGGTLSLLDVELAAGVTPGFITGTDATTGYATIQVGELGAGGDPPCFATGTLIETDTGDVAVEALRPGDRVRTVLGGDLAAVVWIGHRRVDCASHPDPRRVWPFRIAADAFGPGLPRRTLLLSPDHAVFDDGVLIPIRCLANGTTICQVPMAEMTYWHVELPVHDVIRAEGLPAESFLDTGGRTNFDNGGAVTRLFPDFSATMWEAEACAELVQWGPKLAASRERLAQRAAAWEIRRMES